MYHEYPYTSYFHDIDRLCRACHDAGYKLLVDANALKLLNKNDEVVSTVVIHYAETALSDVDGKALKAYIFNASTDTDELILTKGDGSTLSLTIPFATKAEKDKLNKDLTDYVYEVQASGDKIQIVKGDSTVTEITVPFATKALTDTNGKDIKTYAATMVVDGDYIVLRDSTGAELARLTAPYAIKAFSDDDGDHFTTTYATTLEAGTTTVVLKAKDGNTLSTITVPYATKALTDNNGNAFLHDYAKTIVVDGDGKRIGLEAHDGTRLATITVPFATLATDATNAVETISVVGDQLVFTTYGGQTYAITAPYAVKAQKDDMGNTIKSTYIASVTNDAQTGKLTFKDALGQTIVELTPTVSRATYDSYNNLIADYVKTILASASSDYVTITHGDGDTEQITINYATHAWKDTNENVIKNTYIKRLACVEDVNDHHYKLVAYNGDTPEAELFRIELIAYEAQRAIGDKNGVDITTYVHDVTIDASTKEVVVKDGTNTEKARFKAGGTQLKYDDGGTLTDIDEAELGEGLEYDEQNDVINCTVEPGTKVFPLAAKTTPTRVNVVQGTSYEEWGTTYIEPNEIYLPDTSATIDTAADFDTFIATIAVGDLLTIDFSAVSSIIDGISTSQNIIILQYQNSASGFISIMCTSTDIINNDYVITVEAYMDNSIMRFRLANIDMYNDLYLGTDFKVEDDELKLAQPAEQYYNSNFIGNEAQDGVYPAISVDLTDNAKYHAGDEVLIDGWDQSLYPDYGRAQINGLNFPALATHSHFILKRWRMSDIGGQGQVSDWELVYALPRGVSGAYESAWNDKEYTPTTALELIGGYGNDVALVAAADFSTTKPKYIPYNSSTATTPDYYAYAENDKKRAEIFVYNTVPTYDCVKPYDGIVPYIPKFISTVVDSSDETVIPNNLAPAIQNSDGSYSISGNPITQGMVIVVVYDKI